MYPMSTRIQHFEALAAHPWLQRVYAKLNKAELGVARQFLTVNALLDKGAFEKAVNRMFLDQIKPPHWKEICELLTCANSATSN